jgi:glycine hydroxymethyltransferase
MQLEVIRPRSDALADPELKQALLQEEQRQQDHIEMIAPENIVSRDVRSAQGSILANKYAEGCPARRYYGGCEAVDLVEQLAIDRARKLFGAAYANVQPHSGANANIAALFALLEPRDRIMGLDLACGGHLTHGSPVSLSGRWFDVSAYKVRHDDELIDYDEMERLALAMRPRLIFAGGSAYPRRVDFARMREIADRAGACLVADVAHYAGLIATRPGPRSSKLHASCVSGERARSWSRDAGSAKPCLDRSKPSSAIRQISIEPLPSACRFAPLAQTTSSQRSLSLT